MSGCRVDEAVVIRIHKSYAHPGGVYVYRITWRGKSIVYATDTEGYVGTDRKLVAVRARCGCVDPRCTIFGGTLSRTIGGVSIHTGIWTLDCDMACEVAAASEAGQLILFHHDPAYSDEMVAGMEATAKSPVR